MAKPEILPLSPEDREAIERVSTKLDETMATPSSPYKKGDPANSGGDQSPRGPDDDLRAALVDIERLSLLAYVGTSILLNRFGVTEEEFKEEIARTVAFLRRSHPPAPATPAPSTPNEKENV